MALPGGLNGVRFGFSSKWNCNHSTQFSVSCDKCFEAKGASSRYLEAHCKVPSMPLDPQASPSFPWDLHDFSRCAKIMDKHPSWNIEKMRAHGKEWGKLVDKWDKLMQMYHDGMKESLDVEVRACSQ